MGRCGPNDAGPSGDRQQFTVVGVIPTVRHEELRAEPRLVQVYVPLAQSPYLQVRLLVHTNGEPLAWLKPVREAVLSVDPELPVFEARTMDDDVSASVASQQLAMTLISFFAILAWILAVVGLYGMLAYTVSRRASEIGIRVTLGASRQKRDRIIYSGRNGSGWHWASDWAARTGSTRPAPWQLPLSRRSLRSNYIRVRQSPFFDYRVSRLPHPRFTRSKRKPPRNDPPTLRKVGNHLRRSAARHFSCFIEAS